MTQSPHLSLPLLAPAQAQKHVTVNEAVLRLESANRHSVRSRTLTQPPPDAAEGDRFIVPDNGSFGDAAVGQIAALIGGSWWAMSPETGQRVWCDDEALFLTHHEGDWQSGDAAQTEASRFGVNTQADSTNRLAVKSDAILLSHDDITPGSGDVRLSLNRASDNNVAGILFQSGYSGRVAMQLGSQADFAISTSPDGAQFHDAIRISDSGSVSFPGGVDLPPVLHGRPDAGLGHYDTLYLDPSNGDDTATGRSISEAVQSVQGLATVLPVGRWAVVFLLGDIEWDWMISLAYPLAKLEFRGLSSDGSAYVTRTIRVRDAQNAPGYSGGLQLRASTSLEFVNIDIQLDSAGSFPFLFFDSTIGYLKTYNMTVTRTGSGSACLFGPSRSFVASFHDNLTIDMSASGFIFDGVGAGADPNAGWGSPSNMTAF